ncbi:hypothetical protein [Streptomyces neyagawaensis]|uniref:hypothetical protein n=1 Tax=Streptomyces neyagawaensis TaxID=42238 RepID=UPI0035573BB3
MNRPSDEGKPVAVTVDAKAPTALAGDPASHLYGRPLDAPSFAPDAEKLAVPWREVGRRDLTPAVLFTRLETCPEALFARYG